MSQPIQIAVTVAILISAATQADGAIDNGQYCSITKQHTMCLPEVVTNIVPLWIKP